jgi:hypothetical protein
MKKSAYTTAAFVIAGALVLANPSRAEERMNTAQARAPSDQQPKTAARPIETMTPCKRLLLICTASKDERAAAAACDTFLARCPG